MSLRDIVEKIAIEGGEEFIHATDKKHAESMRVSAFNHKRRLPDSVIELVGIQKMEENGNYFVRIYKKDITNLDRWIRDEEGNLTPAPKSRSKEETRMAELMRKDGMSEEDIEALITTEEDG